MIINNNKSKLRNATNTLANDDLFHFQTLQRVDDLQLGVVILHFKTRPLDTCHFSLATTLPCM